MISVIIVAFNEEHAIKTLIKDLTNQVFIGDFEIILADGGSTDGTIEAATNENLVIARCRKGKAQQINDAVKVAKGDILFFLHADMSLKKNTLTSVSKVINNGFSGGGFANVFDTHNEKIKKIGRWMNFRFFNAKEQSDSGIFYGDNGVFVKTSVFNNLKGFKEIPIMEDYDFSKRLKANYKIKKVTNPMLTVSSRRHVKTGFYKTRFLWIAIRKLYKLGVSPFLLASWYKNVR